MHLSNKTFAIVYPKNGLLLLLFLHQRKLLKVLKHKTTFFFSRNMTRLCFNMGDVLKVQVKNASSTKQCKRQFTRISLIIMIINYFAVITMDYYCAADTNKIMCEKHRKFKNAFL